MLSSEAEILTIKMLEKIPKNFFVFRPCRASSYKPPSSRENNISPLFAFRVCWGDHPLSIGVGWRYEGDHVIKSPSLEHEVPNNIRPIRQKIMWLHRHIIGWSAGG
jgi:hypothetical protein